MSVMNPVEYSQFKNFRFKRSIIVIFIIWVGVWSESEPLSFEIQFTKFCRCASIFWVGAAGHSWLPTFQSCVCL